MSLDPVIKMDKTNDGLLADIKEAAEELRDDDKFSAGVEKTLVALGIRKPAEKKVETKPDDRKDKDKPKSKTSKVTKKSIIIGLLERKSGATLEQMAEACTKAGLGDHERNLSTAKLWIPKIGFKTKKNDKGVYTKA
jgi:hypothetical protein